MEGVPRRGADVSGFSERRKRTASRIKPGDFLLCYMTGVSRWVGILEVLSPMFIDKTPIWNEEAFPVRFRVKPRVLLEAETGVPIMDLKDRLSYFEKGTSPNVWTGYFRGSPTLIKPADAAVIHAALEEASVRPVVRPVEPEKLRRRVKMYKTKKIGEVTIPEPEEAPAPLTAEGKEPTHEEIQHRLVRLGADLGLDVWVARNDKGREVNGVRLGEMPRVRPTLPLQFDEATNRTIELIDVLWLQGNAIVAAFEVEHSTSIYSGLLRMADLKAMQPNLTVPLYIVAADGRRRKVVEEVNRPTFGLLKPPLRDVCRFIPYSRLVAEMERFGAATKHLKPEFLADLSESCTPRGEE
jgi:hypothetical protein